MSPSTVTALVTEDTAEQPSSSSTSSQPAAVHALNILRALYRDSRLGEHIVPFIPQGVMIAIEGFSAPLWPVSEPGEKKRKVGRSASGKERWEWGGGGGGGDEN